MGKQWVMAAIFIFIR
ncbi:KxYKxGKxW signal peptide domain-containing protein [Clostridium pasteurianum]